MMEEEHEKSSLRAFRRKKSSVGLSSCFNVGQNRKSTVDSGYDHHDDYDSSPGVAMPPGAASPRMRAPSCNWMIKPSSRPGSTHDVHQLLPASDHIKGKYRSFISRMSRHRRHSSADQFSYDPLSYALNFDDEDYDNDNDAKNPSAFVDDESRRRAPKSFISRLPASPPMMRTTSNLMSYSSSSSRKTTIFDRHDYYYQVASSSSSSRRRDQDQDQVPTPKATAANHELRRGFEALSASMRRSSLPADHHHQRIRMKAAELQSSSSTMRRAAAVSQVRKSLELDHHDDGDDHHHEVKSLDPVRIASSSSSSRREILVQLC